MLITRSLRLGRGRMTSVRMTNKFWETWDLVLAVEGTDAESLTSIIEMNRMALAETIRPNRTESIRDFLLHYIQDAAQTEINRRLHTKEWKTQEESKEAA